MDFGFKISPSSTINLDKVDLSLYNRVRELVPDIDRCMACGSCSATCPASEWSGMSMRKLLLNLRRGKEEDIRKMLSNCMLCGKCTMVCPRGINTRHIILEFSRLYNPEEKK